MWAEKVNSDWKIFFEGARLNIEQMNFEYWMLKWVLNWMINRQYVISNAALIVRIWCLILRSKLPKAGYWTDEFWILNLKSSTTYRGNKYGFPLLVFGAWECWSEESGQERNLWIEVGLSAGHQQHVETGSLRFARDDGIALGGEVEDCGAWNALASNQSPSLIDWHYVLLLVTGAQHNLKYALFL